MTGLDGTEEHAHELALVDVHFEEGVTAHEYVCRGCGWVWFEAASPTR